MRLRGFFLASILLGFVFVGNVGAQVLATGETGGKGGQAVFLTANGLYPEGLSLFNANVQYSFGLTDKVDVVAIYGNISALGENQHYAGFGWNVNLLKRNQALVDVSFFNTVTFPVSRRSESSTVLLTPALVVSRPVTIAGRTVAIYTGLNSVVPIGNIQDKLFTPPETLLNVPAGVSVVLSKKWVTYVEYDYGSNLSSVGVGILRVF